MRVPRKGPVTLGAMPRSSFGELRMISRTPSRILADANPVGAVADNPPCPVLLEEIKQIRRSVLDTSATAKQRARRLDDSLEKLDNYSEAANSKKQRKDGTLACERSAHPKLATEKNQNSSEIFTVGSEIREKNVTPNDGARLSVAGLRAKNWGNSLTKRTLEEGKCREMIKDAEGSGPVDKKSQLPPSGGDDWDKKIVRKCFPGKVHSGATYVDEQIKPKMLHMVNSESVLQSYNSRVPRGKMIEDATVANSSLVANIKGSRAPRSGSSMAASPPADFARVPSTFEAQERHYDSGKLHLAGEASNREHRTLSIPLTIQWVGVGRRQNKSHNKRVDNVFPVSDSSYVQLPERCDPPQYNNMAFSNKANRSQFTKDGASGIPQLKVKQKGHSSPTRLSVSEESGGRLSDKIGFKEVRAGSVEFNKGDVEIVRFSSSTLAVAKKNITSNCEKTVDGKQRQERSRKISSLSKSRISTRGEKSAMGDSKPVRDIRHCFQKNESKTGSGCPPVGKLSDRRTFAQQGKSLLDGVLDLDGGSDEDCSEFLDAPNSACRNSCVSLSEELTKDMESVFSQKKDKDSSYLKEQRQLLHEGSLELQSDVPNEREQIIADQYATVKLAAPGCQVRQAEEMGKNKSCTKLDTGVTKIPPLFGRVLSALILEDETPLEEAGEESGDDYQGANSHDCNSEEAFFLSSLHESNSDVVRTYLCNEMIGKNIQSGFPKYELPKGDCHSMHEEQALSNIAKNSFLPEALSAAGTTSLDERYQRMSIESRLVLELHSLGLYPEPLPDLVDGEDVPIVHDISGLQEQTSEQVSNSKACVDQSTETILEETSMNEKNAEGTAVDRLVEPSYQKQMATRTRTASRIGMPEVAEEVAPTFTEMTLRRCTPTSQHNQLTVPDTEDPWDLDFDEIGPISSKYKEALWADHGGIGGESSPSNTWRSEAKGVMSCEDVDKRKGGGEIPGDCSSVSMMETKPKQNTAQISTAGAEISSEFGKAPSPVSCTEVVTDNADKTEEFGSANPEGNNDLLKFNLPMDMLDNLDLPSWLNFEGIDGLLDGDSMGLDIPMDDLGDVGLLL